MTLQDWSNLAQVIGALAVVISLFYVGFQIKGNTSAVRSATAQAVHDNYADWYMTMAGDAELNQIAIKGLKDYSSLNETEKARFIETFMAFYIFLAKRLLPVAGKSIVSAALGRLGVAHHEFALFTWRQRILEGTRVCFRERIPGLCGESHYDKEAPPRSQAPRCFQDRLTGT